MRFTHYIEINNDTNNKVIYKQPYNENDSKNESSISYITPQFSLGGIKNAI